MRRLIVLGVLIAGGVAVWQIGNKLSSDAISMAVGLIFGTLALLPATVMVLATSGRRRDVDDGGAYQAGIRDATALALGTLPHGQQHTAQWQPTTSAVIVVERPTKYTLARPFDIVVRPPDPPQLYRCGLCSTVYSGDKCPGCGTDDFQCQITREEARQAKCANWQRCPDCGWPITPDEHCPEWCGVPARRFQIVGEVEQ
jgi:hypothetical protein